MGDQILRMDAPAHQALCQFLHLPKGSDPGTIDGLLSVDNIRAGREGAASSFPYKGNPAPVPSCPDGKLPSCVAGAGVDRPLHAVSSGRV